MDRCGHEFQLNVVCSSWSSAAGYLTVLKNNFACTQAAEMGEDPPLTYFCRSRHMRRHLGPIEATPTRRHDGSSEGAPIPRKQLSASSSGPSTTRGVEFADLEAECACSALPRLLGVHAAAVEPRGSEMFLLNRVDGVRGVSSSRILRSDRGDGVLVG